MTHDWKRLRDDLGLDHAVNLGRYVVMREIGRGGMATVFEAEDRDLGRRVALKVLRDPSPRLIERLHREASAAARLRHPNIVAVHEVGSVADEQGRTTHFIAMDYVPGRTFADVMPNLTLRERVVVVEAVARAVAYAHDQGVVHRDVKPQNVLMEPMTVCDASGLRWRVFLGDFGLAKLMDGEHLTRTGAIMGTPNYMAPEQVRGEVKNIGPRTDVWGLGAMLYEAAAGHPPFEASTAVELYEKILCGEIPPLRASGVPSDLETIVQRCMEREPARRYPSASQAGADLVRWLAGEPILARPPSAWTVLRRRLARRKPMVAAVSAAFLAAALVGGIAGIRLIHEREHARAQQESVRELGKLWAEIVLAKQGLYIRTEDPSRVRQQLEAAVERVTSYVGSHPGIAEGYYVRARGKLYLDDLRGAEADLRRARALDPSLAPVEALLGRVLLERYTVEYAMGPSETAHERQQHGTPLLKEARACLERAMRCAGTWTLPHTREDDVAELLSRALVQAYVDANGNAAVETLLKANGEAESEEYCFWIAASRDKPAQKVEWLEKAIARMPHYTRAHHSLGSTLSTRGELPGAIVALEAAIRISPRFWPAHESLSHVHYQAGRLDEALVQINRALQLNPTSVYALQVRGMIRAAQGDETAAVADYTASIDVEPRSAIVHHNRANARARLGDVQGALSDYSRAVELNPGLVEAWSGRSRLRVQTGDLDGAMEDCLRALKVNPDFVPALLNEGTILQMRGSHEAALKIFTRALDLDPRSAGAYSNRAVVRVLTGDVAGAIDDCTKALAVDGRWVDAYVTRCRARRETGDVPGAIADGTAAIAIDARCVEAYVNRGRARKAAGDREGAITDYTRAIELDPRHFAAHKNRGNALAERGDLDAALADGNRAIQLQPEDADAYFNRSIVHWLKHQRDECLRDLNEAIARNPTFVQAYANRGALRESMGDLDGGLRDYDEALRLEPGMPDTSFNRGSARLKKGDAAGALADLNVAVEKRPGHAMAYHNRGAARLRLKEWDGALADFDKAIALDPAIPEPYAGRAGAREILAGRRPDEARNLLQGAAADLRRALERARPEWPRDELEAQLKRVLKALERAR